MGLPLSNAAISEQTYVLLNPHAAGGSAARFRPALLKALATRGLQHNLLLSDTPENALGLINALPAGSRVIAVGGDGTVQNLLPSLLAGGHTLALLPMGSGNDTARALGLTQMRWQAALDHALTGTASLIDLGEARFNLTQNGQAQHILFISSLTAGFDSAVNLRALNGPRYLSGMLRYLWATLGELMALRSWHLQVTVDGTLHHDGKALFASTLNTRTFGGGMPAMPHARIDDGQLNLLHAGDIGMREILHLLPRLLAGWHLNRPKVSHAALRRMQIESTQAFPLAADGEYLGETSTLEVRIRPACLSVVRSQN